MRILVVAKHSKFEWEQKKLQLTASELKDKLSAEGANLDTILESHECQLNNRYYINDTLESLGANHTMCMMDNMPTDTSDYDVILSLGGDNSFTYISHFVTDAVLIGVNSDPERSVGSLTRWKITDKESAKKLIDRISRGNFVTESWTRLGATINGNKIPLATSEYFFGEKQRNKMSRHILEFNGQTFEQKCSGIIIATGAGSTGWYNSVYSHYAGWDPEDLMASFVVTEPYNQEAICNSRGVIRQGEEIILRSLNDGEGIVSVDAWSESTFQRGSEAKIYLDKPLKIGTPYKRNIS